MKYLINNWHKSWDTFFSLIEDELTTIDKKLYQLSNDNVIFPEKENIFKAFQMPFDNLKVVVVGQDPYHGEGEAMGIAFSVPKDSKIPPSLRNIYKELSDDIGVSIPNNGDLSKWCNEGVFLINATLTVNKDDANSHNKIGWDSFTNKLLQYISDKSENIAFILWGGFARKKKKYIDSSKHLIIESAHPSPLSVYRGFWGSKPFSKVNDYLTKVGKGAIDWSL